MRQTSADFEAALTRFAEAGVRFVVIGGVSAALQGVPAVTFDLDLVLDHAEHQGILDGLFGEALSQKATDAYLARAAESIQFVRDAADKEVIELTQAQQDEIDTVLRPIYDEWLASMTEQGIDGQAMLDAAGVNLSN